MEIAEGEHIDLPGERLEWYPQAPDLRMTPGAGGCFTVETGAGFWTRLWYLTSNPFLYLFTGRWRL